MNVNYIGSFAEQNMLFRSSVDVVETLTNEPFHCLSVYIPSNIAPAVIQGYANDAPLLTKEKPLVYSCDVQNYADIMTGELLTQMQPIFRGDSNTDVVIYLIVFYCDETNDGWKITDTTIEYEPLTKAFEKLYFISFIKMLFDPNMNGVGYSIESVGAKTMFTFNVINTSKTTRVEGSVGGIIQNPTGSVVTLDAGDYLTDNNYAIHISEDLTIPANGSYTFDSTNTKVTVQTTPAFTGVFPLSLPLTPVDLTTLASSHPTTWGAINFTLNQILHTGQTAGNPVAVTIDAGEYNYTDPNNGVQYKINITSPISLKATGSVPSRVITAFSVNVGNIASSVTLQKSGFTEAFGHVTNSLTPGDVSFDFNVLSFTPGVNAGVVQDIESKFFDLSLAFAYLCKLNPTMSQFWSQVRIQEFIDGFPNITLGAGDKLSDYDPNKCFIRSATVAEEKAEMVNLLMAGAEKRAKYYWGALKLMQANNTFLVCHAEPNDLNGSAVNILSEILSVWFAKKNSSGLYVGNKVHNIRLTGSNIKPLGWPSPLNSAVNENDAGAVNILGEKNVAYLQTISDNSLEDCRLTSARTLDGISLNAKMISKWVDYRSAMDCANMITDRGTLTDPVLTNNEAYTRIQSIVGTNLARFSNLNRLYNVKLTFPSFTEAKKGLTALEAASAWSALYVDDLDKVTVTGGISEI